MPFSLDSLKNWTPPSEFQKITTIDAHTGGEPLRIVTSGLPELPGKTILEKRKHMRDHFDHYRKILMWEPRGHADMYGCIITPPTTGGSDFGVIFLHNEGYSTMCGHGIIAVTKVAIECGLVSKKAPTTEVTIDTPAGLVKATATIHEDRVEKVSFVNVPSFVQALDLMIDVDGTGKVKYDIAFGGAFYAYVDATKIGISLQPENHSELIQKGMAIKRAVMQSVQMKHPFEEDLNFLYGTIFVDSTNYPTSHSRNVCIFAEGEVDRSPTGTGVSGRVAIEVARGRLQLKEKIAIESIVGSKFTCSAIDKVKFGDYDAVIPQVEGTAFISGMNTFLIDPNDPQKNGFILR